MIVDREPRLTGAEVLGATAVSWLASVVVFAYFADRIGLTIASRPILAASIAAGAAMFLWLRRGAVWRPGGIAAFTSVIGVMLVWLAWLAWPELLPPGGGSDLAHHLQLVDYIDRHRQLVHDPTVEWYLGEMVHYTPGAHLLSSLAGRWIGSDGFHAVYPVVALTVAIKAGFVFLIAERMAGLKARTTTDGLAGLKARTTPVELAGLKDGTTTPFCILAVLLLFLPRAFFVGSFARYSYIAQVVSELFAVAMWWALVAWDERPTRLEPLIVFAIAGVATFLSWPIWIGPPLVALALLAITRRDLTASGKLSALALGALPILVVAAVHTAGRAGWARIVGVGTDTPLPTWNDFTWWFIALSAAGMVAVSRVRRGRVTALLLFACAVQAAALYGIAKANGAAVPYMAIKMAYFAIYPLAVAGAFAVALAWQFFAARVESRLSFPVKPDPRLGTQAVAWMLILVLAIVIGIATLRARMPKPVVSESLYLAGEWARAHVDPACVDYVVAHDNTAYWLHLSVLGNRRMSDRTADDSTFIPRDGIVRWINQGGLPYAIADLGTIPRDVLESTDEIARFGSAVVIKRRGETNCDRR